MTTESNLRNSAHDEALRLQKRTQAAPDRAHKPRSLDDLLGKLGDTLGEAQSEWADKVKDAAPGETIPCPGRHCEGRGQCAVDVERSIVTSGRIDNLHLEFVERCETCTGEAARLERLKKMGVPHRVLTASLENFDTSGSHSAKKREVVRQAIQWKAHWRGMPFLLLLGGTGAGKGHIASAIFQSWDGTRGARIWIDQSDLFATRQALSIEQEPGYMGRLKRAGLLVLDEIGFGREHRNCQSVYHEILNARHDAKLPTLLLSNLPLTEAGDGGNEDPRKSLAGFLGFRMVSRIREGHLVMDFSGWPDWRKRKA